MEFIELGLWSCFLASFRCVLHFTVCSFFTNFKAGGIRSKRLLPLDFNGSQSFDLIPVGGSLFRAGTTVTLGFASPRLLRFMDWPFHLLQLPNMNVVVTSGFAVHTLLRASSWV